MYEFPWSIISPSPAEPINVVDRTVPIYPAATRSRAYITAGLLRDCSPTSVRALRCAARLTMA